VQEKPLSYLNEIAKAFEKKYALSISVSHVFHILTQHWGLTRQKVERRAMEIQMSDIVRFAREVNEVSPLYEQLLFADEFGSDNRDMLRLYGWFAKGNPYMHSNFRRRERHSFLGFCGCDGLVEIFHTEGTFDRHVFFDCCRRLVNSGKVPILVATQFGLSTALRFTEMKILFTI
jgi:hypothetical protein